MTLTPSKDKPFARFFIVLLLICIMVLAGLMVQAFIALVQQFGVWMFVLAPVSAGVVYGLWFLGGVVLDWLDRRVDAGK